MLRRILLALPILALTLAAQPKAVLLISIDGLRPDAVTQADQHGLKIPNLRQFLKTGAYAQTVRGVLPTVTYPSHTTIITGVWPAKHGIANNVTFDPLVQNLGGWYWYAEDIKVPTLWDAAAKAGIPTGSVSWPVTVGARAIQFNVPEIWRAWTADDARLIRSVTTPATLMQEFEPTLKPYYYDQDKPIETDRVRTRYAERMIRAKKARFITVHLAGLDHVEHDSGQFSAESNKTLEATDEMVGVLIKAIREQTPDAAIAIVSDHGFAKIDRQLNLKTAFVKAGLLTPDPKKPGAVSDWKADAWAASACVFVVLKDPKDAATPAKVEAILKEVAADPANGVASVLDKKQIAAMGGTPAADYVVDMKSGFSVGNALDGALIRSIKPGGTHGYSPANPDMRATFLITGPGIRAGLNLGDIDMRSIAPTLAKFLELPFPSADLPALDLFEKRK